MTEITYDVFISHAFEDKNTFTNELAYELKKKGLKVWYSGFELKLGDSIMSSVNNALKSAEYAVVVVSPIYLEKQWAMSELKALFTQESQRNRILPILHNISMDEIKAHLPMLADRFAISSAKGLDFIVNKILEVVKGKTISAKEMFGSKREKDNQNDGHITLGAGDNKKNNVVHDSAEKKTITNKNSNEVAVNVNSNNTSIFIIIIIIIIAAFLIIQNVDFSSSAGPPTIDKSNSRPSNSE